MKKVFIAVGLLLVIIISSFCHSYVIEGATTQNQAYSQAAQSVDEEETSTPTSDVIDYDPTTVLQTDYNDMRPTNEDDIEPPTECTEDVDGNITGPPGVACVKDRYGEIVAIPSTDTGNFGTALYYEPGSYPFGITQYVPSHSDSVYLSRALGQSTLGEYIDNATVLGGECEKNKHSPMELEHTCVNTDKNKCASMSCCVLLGGSKCVSGNETGPHIKSNYSDTAVRNRDYYYYKGKCYGNCQ
tara:strand:+ start:674 stop:1402 length:729 start_codon:yes stop_codon:yes gene_type:complete